MSEWISVKDKMPEPWEDVLVAYRDIKTVVDIDCVGHEGTFLFKSKGTPTHWMPLPAPPKKEDEQ